MATVKIEGLEDLRQILHNIAEKVPNNARGVMHRGADKIVERAKLFTPRDTGALEDAIHQESSYGYRGRLTIEIICGGGVNPKTGQPVDDYAAEIHESYNDEHPGPGTVAKMNANPGVVIGDHFMTRALDEQAPKIEAAMIEATEVSRPTKW